MRRDCFCGCGRRLRYWDARVSKKGALVKSIVDLLDENPHAEFLPPERRQNVSEDELAAFKGDGLFFQWELAAIVHRDAPATAIDRPLLNSWLKAAYALTRWDETLGVRAWVEDRTAYFAREERAGRARFGK